jgi:hypothetical protein
VSGGWTGPLVIGGVGGSGTRVVAEMARRLGVSLGEDRNRSVDTLAATLLLRRPAWYDEQVREGGAGFVTAFEILEGALRGRLEVTAAIRDFLAGAEADLAGDGPGPAWAAERVARLVGSGTAGPEPERWGWKEPNSHVYLEALARHFGDRLRYVHVLRNGLDMAFSDNQWQVRTWGRLFGIEAGATVSPNASLDYWIRANRRAVDLGEALPAGTFLRLDVDALCADPVAGVDRLVGFLGLEPEPEVQAELVAMPERPASTGRWRRAGGVAFTDRQLAEVAALGFPFDR